MTKLTDTQTMLLASAAQRRDGAVTLPENTPAARGRIAQALLRRALVEDVRASRGMPIWRRDDQDRALSLTITPAGLAAINADETPPAIDGLDLARPPADAEDIQTLEPKGAAVLAALPSTKLQPATTFSPAAAQAPRERTKIAGADCSATEKSVATLVLYDANHAALGARFLRS